MDFLKLRSGFVTWAAIAVSSVILIQIHPLAIAAFLAYAIMLPAEERRHYAWSWASFAVSILAFNSLRSVIGADIIKRGRPVFSAYAIAGDRALLGGRVAPELFRGFSAPWLDWLSLGLHFSHFVFFLLFAVAVWWSRRSYGRWVQRAFLIVFAVGLVSYYLVPTVPPWLAAEQGLLPPIRHTSHILYTQWMSDGTVELLDTNPVAAMPSLHAAFPFVCAFVAWFAFPRFPALMISVYAVLQSVGVMYLGEHYLVDVIAGAALGVIAAALTRPPSDPEACTSCS